MKKYNCFTHNLNQQQQVYSIVNWVFYPQRYEWSTLVKFYDSLKTYWQEMLYALFRLMHTRPARDLYSTQEQLSFSYHSFSPTALTSGNLVFSRYENLMYTALCYHEKQMKASHTHYRFYFMKASKISKKNLSYSYLIN